MSRTYPVREEARLVYEDDLEVAGRCLSYAELKPHSVMLFGLDLNDGIGLPLRSSGTASSERSSTAKFEP